MQLEKFIKSIEYGVCDQLTPLVRRVIANNPGVLLSLAQVHIS